MATLTATGAVNLTTSTNWSPAQIPATGDDLVVGAFTLTLDADLTLNTLTLNNAAARLAIGGTTRSVTFTNGISIAAAIAGALIGTAIPSGTSLTITGTWTNTLAVSAAFAVATSTGGNLTLQTVGASRSAVLWSCPGATAQQCQITTSWAGGTLTTTGRFTCQTSAALNPICVISAGTWTHNSDGDNIFSTSAHRLLNATGTANVNWSGSIDSQSVYGGSMVAVSGLFCWASSGTLNLGESGDYMLLRSAANAAGNVTSVVSTSNGTVNVIGRLASRAGGICGHVFGGTLNYTNQTVAVDGGDDFSFVVSSGTLNMNGLDVDNSGRTAIIVYGAGACTTDGSSNITNITTSATAGVVGTTSFDGKIVTLGSNPPTLPAVSDVASGVSYGYAGTPLTGTGVIVSSGTIAAGVASGLDTYYPNDAAYKRAIGAICSGEVTGGASTTTTINTTNFSPAGAAADQFKGRLLVFAADTTTAALRGQAALVTASSNATNPVLTVSPLTTAPAAGDTFTIT